MPGTKVQYKLFDLDLRSKVTDVEVSTFSECFLFFAFRVDQDTLIFFENFSEREAQNARNQSEQDANAKRKAWGSKAIDNAREKKTSPRAWSERVAPQY